MNHRLRLLLVPALLLATPALAKAPVSADVATAEAHAVAIEGTHNFRDAGGYLTADGRTVRRGKLFRSASLANVTAGGQAQLRAMHVAAIIDLRSTDERRGDPNAWQAEAGMGYWSRDYRLDSTGFAGLFGDPKTLTAERVRAAMAEGYRGMPKTLAPSYRELFARLGAGRGATIVNCTAGKDRTGIGAALVLTALGVPYHTVRADFLLSNAAIRQQIAPGGNGFGSGLNALPPEVVAPLAGVEGEYLDAAFDQIRKDYISVEAYLERELGVGPREIATLRRRMLR